MSDAAIDVVRDAVASSSDEDLVWLEPKLLLARGHYAPDQFEDTEEVPGLVAAWEKAGKTLRTRELLYLYGMGGHPGGAWAEIIRAHDLPGGPRIYSRESDYADLGEQGTFLIAVGEKIDNETDAQVVEELHSLEGQELAQLFFTAIDKARTVLPRERLMPHLLKALDETVAPDGYDDLALNQGYESLDEFVEAAEAPEGLKPDSREWKAWFVENYLDGVLSE
jgi:hypothetical protein